MALYPTLFQPIFKERVWGGRALERLYRKPLPPDVPIGESWEVADRPGDESVIANGPFAGRTLRWLMETHGGDVLGTAVPAAGDRFPLLCKILDARERLSLQVHPPPRVAHLGDPKTEMWFIVAAVPGAELFVGLRRGITREAFERAVAGQRCADCFHRIPVHAGDAMFLPSGRVHAIGAGLVIFEIQQNSDTTFRVHDWDRVGLDGKARELHVPQSLESIDFADVEPTLVDSVPRMDGATSRRALVRDPLFDVDELQMLQPAVLSIAPGTLRVVAATEGTVTVAGGGVTAPLAAGQFAVLPAAMHGGEIAADAGARFLMVEAGAAVQ
jgi:mannose-6-phosphate isomerase